MHFKKGLHHSFDSTSFTVTIYCNVRIATPETDIAGLVASCTPIRTQYKKNQPRIYRPNLYDEFTQEV